jgi:hypothetical protein
LEFATASFGDATALLDAVSIVQRDTGEVVLQNPSFEASGVVGFPGYIQPNKIAGWTSTGNYGVNVSGVGPFADNGRNRDQDNVLFIQGQDSSSSQLVTGLTPGQIYTLAYDYNARGGNTPTLKVTIGSVTAQDEAVSPVGGTNPYHRRTFSFVAEADSALLKFTQTAAGDQTVLIDNVSVRVGGSAPEVRLRAEQGAGGTIRLIWPASAQGYVLQFKNDILGQWSTSAAPEMLEGDQKVVTDSLVGTTRFYRLVKP